MRFFTHNIGWKLLSLAAGFAVWMNIASEPDLATVLSAPVEYKNYPNNLEISSDIVETIDVEARGPAGQVRDLNGLHIAAIIDFAGVTSPGERTFTLSADELKLPRGIELIRTIPEQLRFTFERGATRALTVEILFSGKLPPGLTVASFEVQPPTLTIEGPESRVAAVTKAISDPYDLSHVTVGDSERTLAVYIAEPQVRFLGTAQVTVKIHVEPTH